MLFWKINPDGLDNIWESYLGFGFKFIDIIAYSDIYLDKLQKTHFILKICFDNVLRYDNIRSKLWIWFG